MLSYLQELHSQLFFNLHALLGYSEFTDATIYFFAQTIDFYVVGLAMFFVLVHQHSRNVKAHDDHKKFLIKELFLMTYAVLVAWFVAYLLKLTIGGLRPFEFYEYLEPLFLYAGGDSFPSGHATLFSALALMLTSFHRKVGLVFVFIALLISFSRVIAGVHFPIDILGGWIIGAGVSYAVYYMFRKKNLVI